MNDRIAHTANIVAAFVNAPATLVNLAVRDTFISQRANVVLFESDLIAANETFTPGEIQRALLNLVAIGALWAPQRGRYAIND